MKIHNMRLRFRLLVFFKMHIIKIGMQRKKLCLNLLQMNERNWKIKIHQPNDEELAKIGALRVVKREWTRKNAQEVKVEAENKAAENKELREANAALNSRKAPVSEAEISEDNSTGNEGQERENAKNEPVWTRAANSVNPKIRPITEMKKPVETTVPEE